jgi:hypothetical protein
LKIYLRTSKKKYLHGKRVYEYERLYVPVPRPCKHIVKPFVKKDIKVRTEQDVDGFTMKVRLSSRPKSLSSMKNDEEKPSRTP